MLVPGIVSAQVIPLLDTNISSASSTPDVSGLICYDFNRNLHLGSTGEAVRMLQYVLITKEKASINASSYGVFDTSTVAAVNNFQTKYPEISSKLHNGQTTGNVGPLVRAKLKALYGCQNMVASTTAVTSDYSGLVLTVPTISLDNTGVTANFCNKGTTTISVAPFRIRLNGINRDFDIARARTAGNCDMETFPYSTWGLTYDPTVTYTAVALIDPNNMYKKNLIQFPTNGTATLNSYAINGAHLSVRSIILKSAGVQATFCNLGTTNVTSFPVRVSVNGTPKDFDISGAYNSGKCTPMTWPFSTWNTAYAASTTYTVNVQVDPNNIIQEINEFDNAATVVGMP